MDRVPGQRSEVGFDCGDLQLSGASGQPMAQVIREALAFGVEKNQFRQGGSLARLHRQIYGDRCHPIIL